MGSIKCRRCGLTNWDTQELCKRCKSPIGGQKAAETPPVGAAPSYDSFTSPDTAGQYPVGDLVRTDQFSPIQSPAQPNYQTVGEQKMGLAISSLVLGIVAFVTVILLIGVLFAPIGLALGIVALVKAKKQPARFGGKGFAIAGVVLSSLVLLWVPIIAAIAIPNLLAARRAANEGSAVASMRKLLVAQSRYSAQSADFGCADLLTLGQKDYIDAQLSTGQKSGYRFTVENLPVGGCEMHATPLTSSTGERSFYLSTNEGTIHVAKRGGQRANERDEVIISQR